MQKKKYKDLTLSEAKKDSIVLAWGRFNPPTTGHEKLIKAVVSEAKKRGAESITLHVFRKNERARALYKKLGYDEELLRCSKPL